ncbi:MAG: hypothetical protein ACRCX2_23555, partial [Paraclostridium sp.]
LNIFDENANLNQNSFVIEKTNKNIKLDFEKENKNYNIVEKDGVKEITTNKDKFTIKVFVLNETYKQKNQDNYIVVDNGSYEKKYKIFNDRDSRVALIELEGKEEEKEYKVFYLGGETKDKVITIKKDFIKIFAEAEVITGLNEYYLYIEKDDFVKINYEYNNNNLKLEYQEELNRIKINRLNDDNVIEKDTINIYAYDSNGVFKPYTHETYIEFYNDKVVNNFRIDDKFLVDNKIVYPKFDLIFNVLFPTDVKKIYYYDEHENDILKREKVAELIDGKYFIKNITTPLEEYTRYIYVVFNNGVEIRKEILKDIDIKLYLTENNFKLSYTKLDETITFKIKNDCNKEKSTFITIKYNGTLNMTPLTFNPYEVKEITLDGFTNDKFYAFEILFEENGKNYKIDELLIKFNDKTTDFEIKKLPALSIFSLSEPKVFYVETKEDTSNIKIKTISDKRVTKEFNIVDRKVDFQFNDKGVYEIYVYYQNKNVQKLLRTYIMQIYIDKTDYLDYNNQNFNQFSFISSLQIKNKSILSTEDLNPVIEYHLNSKSKKVISPKVNNNEMIFILPKEVGRNEYYYKDINGSLKISDINIKKMFVNATHKFKLESAKNELYQKIENDYIFEDKADITFDIEGLNRLEIYSFETRRTSIQYVMSRNETKVSRILLPCKITAYNNDDLKVEEINVLINTVTKVEFKLFKNTRIKNILNNRFTKKALVMRKDIAKAYIKHEKKHRLYHEFIGIAIYNSITEWLNLSVKERNDILIALDNKAYDKTSIKNTNENLKKLFLEYYNGRK